MLTKKRGRGRPAIPEDQIKVGVPISARVEDWNAIRRLADKTGTTIAELFAPWIRRLVKKGK